VELTVRFGVSRRLLETVVGSMIKAALGDESKAGAGVPEAEVTHRVVPAVFEAAQPAGRAGAVTPSKFSLKAVPLHAVGVGVGVGVPVAVAVAVGVGVGVPPGVGVAVTQGTTQAAVLVMVSTNHPVPATLESEAMRKRSVIVCPLTFGPRFTTVLM